MGVDPEAAARPRRHNGCGGRGCRCDRYILPRDGGGRSGETREARMRIQNPTLTVEMESRRARLGIRAGDFRLRNLGIRVGVGQGQEHPVPRDEHGGHQEDRESDLPSHTVTSSRKSQTFPRIERSTTGPHYSPRLPIDALMIVRHNHDHEIRKQKPKPKSVIDEKERT